jgi:hypothetical protein
MADFVGLVFIIAQTLARLGYEFDASEMGIV